MATGNRTEEENDPLPREVRRALADGYTFVRSRETTKAIAAITVEELIVEQILLLDSDQEVQGNTAQVQDTRTVGSWGVGLLQRLDRLEERLLDPDTGAIAQVRDKLQEKRDIENEESARAQEGLE